jgi:uncharacterized protein YndB with AHSA1/START domain
MHVENTIMIERPIEEVFEYVSTPENDPTWVSVSIRNQRTSPGPMRVGMTIEEDVKIFGRTSRDTWEVTDYEPPTVIAYRATSGLFSGGGVRVRCEPVEGVTRLTHAVEYQPRGIYHKTIAPLMPWATKQLIASMDRTLKDLLEGKTTTSGTRLESAASGVARSVVAGTVLAVSVTLLFLLRRRRGASKRGRYWKQRSLVRRTSGNSCSF